MFLLESSKNTVNVSSNVVNIPWIYYNKWKMHPKSHNSGNVIIISGNLRLAYFCYKNNRFCARTCKNNSKRKLKCSQFRWIYCNKPKMHPKSQNSGNAIIMSGKFVSRIFCYKNQRFFARKFKNTVNVSSNVIQLRWMYHNKRKMHPKSHNSGNVIIIRGKHSTRIFCYTNQRFFARKFKKHSKYKFKCCPNPLHLL